MPEYRAHFDADVRFVNGGGLTAEGFRLDIPACTSRRFEPGASQEVDVVALRGRRLVPGIQIKGQVEDATGEEES